jgi:uncharacterized protein involved in type VI secretion and phage assembly
MDRTYQLSQDLPSSVRRQINIGRSFKNLFGIYRGTVEKTNDTFKLGYVRVRVPNVHSQSLSTDELPLGYVAQPFGGGKNYGNFFIPPVNSSVFVMFENGDPSCPIIIGTWYGDIVDENDTIVDTEIPKPITNCLISHIQENGKAEIDLQRYTQEEDQYISTDAVLNIYRNEPRNYITKSVKGHAIEIDDTGISDRGNADANQSSKHNEGIRLTTRLGQIIHIIDEPGQESILIKNADIKNPDGTVTPGNYVQIDQKSKNINVFSNNNIQEEITTNRVTHIGQDENTVIDNNQNQVVNVDQNNTILNNWNVVVGGNINIVCQGSTILTSIGPILINAGGTANVVCNGSMSATVTGDVSIQAASINLN